MKTIFTTARFLDWQRKLNRPAANKVAVAVDKLRIGLGDIKSLKGGLYEVRISFGPGYRLYFTERDGAIIVLLCGGDKSTQGRDIATAKEMLK